MIDAAYMQKLYTNRKLFTGKEFMVATFFAFNDEKKITTNDVMKEVRVSLYITIRTFKLLKSLGLINLQKEFTAGSCGAKPQRWYAQKASSLGGAREGS